MVAICFICLQATFLILVFLLFCCLSFFLDYSFSLSCVFLHGQLFTFKKKNQTELPLSCHNHLAYTVPMVVGNPNRPSVWPCCALSLCRVGIFFHWVRRMFHVLEDRLHSCTLTCLLRSPNIKHILCPFSILFLVLFLILYFPSFGLGLHPKLRF